eukprot:TRINITY_DN60849_c0_g1_i1.p1 TRINITY_DN60849_c0_g1~~TRINITY_DN60849_c0_g1_i1.p1  ORF type:complete len:569 (-),score=87.86 TRINITY_DN60849_c0_g1_i1:43-1749(-)
METERQQDGFDSQPKSETLCSPSPQLPCFRVSQPCDVGDHGGISGVQPPCPRMRESEASFGDLIAALDDNHTRLLTKIEMLSKECEALRDMKLCPPIDLSTESFTPRLTAQGEWMYVAPTSSLHGESCNDVASRKTSSLERDSKRNATVRVSRAVSLFKATETGQRDSVNGEETSVVSEHLLNEDYSGLRGYFHRFFASVYCDSFIAVIVIIDAILLGIQVESDGMNQHTTSTKVVSSLAIVLKFVFLIELIVRFFTYGLINSLRSSGLMRLDTFVISCSLFEVVYTDILHGAGDTPVRGLSIVRFFRLVRLAKAARMSANFRTLWLLLSGLRASTMTMFWTVFLIIMFSYGFAIVGMELLLPSDRNAGDAYSMLAVEKFGSLQRSMLTLIQILTLDDAADVYRPLIMLSNSSTACLIYFGAFIMIVSITLMNLVTAILVEGALEQAKQDKEAQKEMELRRQQRLLPRLRELFMLIDEDGTGEVSWDEIKECPPEMQEELKNMTKADDLYEIFQLLDDDDSGSLMIDEFLDGILKASSGDIILKLQIKRMMRLISNVKEMVCDPPQSR